MQSSECCSGNYKLQMTSKQKESKKIGWMNYEVVGLIQLSAQKPWLVEDRKKGSSHNGMRSSSKNP
jgi:hypothetical protein